MKNNILEYTKVIKEVSELISIHIGDIHNILIDNELIKIISKYDKNREEHRNAGFNIFNFRDELKNIPQILFT